MQLGTRDGREYTVPHTIGTSAIFQNDVLLKRAGIDPAAPLTSLEQLAENARKVAALGDGAIGISSSCRAPDAAWDFFAWSLGDEAQVEVYAKSGRLRLRGDLAENKYAAADPRGPGRSSPCRSRW
ncbi:hypothetical protein AB0K18_37270 [Nonomuraea sp. NPDC049421]|uniref:hypothetical protein n=1 Tax=Nonomuraea sp. NPDC049421 TaxID=3155275 RepID=UPI003421010F